MKKCNARGSAARDPHGIKQITVGPPHGIKQITMFIRENVECLDSSFTTTTTIKRIGLAQVALWIKPTRWLVNQIVGVSAVKCGNNRWADYHYGIALWMRAISALTCFN
ncbi:hypothetical protein J6590_005665 [Homalodisca vitripennis]|nr:hypothetical protein J6590_005665 [Homalodisca vitripennis]